MDEFTHEVTVLLQRLSGGDRNAEGPLASLLYDHLRDAAKRQLGRSAREHTLQPTALVHEVFLKICKAGQSNWNDRNHFVAVAARAMRQVLISHARERQALKRGGGERPHALIEDVADEGGTPLDILDVNTAMEELAQFDERKHRIVELRFFGGLTVDEIADVLELSKSTIESEWRAARAWMAVRLEQ